MIFSLKFKTLKERRSNWYFGIRQVNKDTSNSSVSRWFRNWKMPTWCFLFFPFKVIYFLIWFSNSRETEPLDWYLQAEWCQNTCRYFREQRWRRNNWWSKEDWQDHSIEGRFFLFWSISNRPCLHEICNDGGLKSLLNISWTSSKCMIIITLSMMSINNNWKCDMKVFQ